MFKRSMSDKVKYLYTPTVIRVGAPVLVDREELEGKQGFQSVFGYPETTTLTIQKQANTKDIQHLPAYCDVLFVDFDDNLEAAEHYGMQLDECGIAYEKYDSGNRSIHYHVPVEPCVGSWVPRAVYQYASKYATGCDLSIYRHIGLFRLVGTWHEKNAGHIKRLLAKASGRSLVMEPPVDHKPYRTSHDIGTPLQFIINKRVDTGGRRCYVYSIGSTCFKRGLSRQEALELALKWNSNCALPPLDPEIVCLKIDEAYR